jgi:SAM-dependent methyltransferase
MRTLTAPEIALTESLLRLAAWLQSRGYAFTTVTPATQARVNARPGSAKARGLRDVFGWSRPFPATLLPPEAMDCLHAGRLLQDAGGGLLRSAVRFSTLEGQLFAHSAYPTTAEDAVFFGPDTVRFVALIADELRRQPLAPGGVVLDLGCGAGPGGIMAARAAAAQQPRLVLSDINAKALRFAAANAAHAGWSMARLAQGDLYGAVEGAFDLIVSNPPYLNDSKQRAYRHGGGRFGEALSVRIVREGLPRLAPGGRLVLYTGVAMVDGEDPLLQGLRGNLDERGWPWSYRELDPDVFGEELDQPAYEEAERIAAVALVVQCPPAAEPTTQLSPARS